jgi:hypothetical protein
MTLFFIIAGAVALGVVIGGAILQCRTGAELGAVLGVFTAVGGVGVALWFGWPLLLALVLSPFQLLNSSDRAQRATTSTEPLTVESDAATYFTQAGIVRLPDVDLSIADQLIGEAQVRGRIVAVLGGVKIDSGRTVVAWEVVRPAVDAACRVQDCDPLVFFAWLDGSGRPLDIVDVAVARSDGHSPSVIPVRLPGGVFGFARDVGHTAQGETTAGCRVYQVVRAGTVVARSDLSREPSAERPSRCA